MGRTQKRTRLVWRQKRKRKTKNGRLKEVRGHKDVAHVHGEQTAYLFSIFVKLESRHALDLAVFTHILEGGDFSDQSFQKSASSKCFKKLKKKPKQKQPNLDFFNFYYLKEDPKPRTPASSTSTFKKTTFLFSGSFDSCCNGQWDWKLQLKLKGLRSRNKTLSVQFPGSKTRHW